MTVHGFLKEVLDKKTAQVNQARSRIPLNTVRKEAEKTDIAANFLSAMKLSCASDIGIIAEIKKASPSRGDIRQDLDPALYAQAYAKGYARAISVLTESHYFKGNLEDLELVCKSTDLPVLRKDFIFTSYQIYEARRAGASSVLLITAILSSDQLKDYICLVRELGMEPLVEITSEKEFEKAYKCNAAIVDINNRNLQTLETDLNVSKRIAAILPHDIIPVEASGICSFKDIKKSLNHNIFNFLVGESIVRSDNPEEFIKNLRNKKEHA